MSFEIVFFIEILSIAGVFNLSKCGLYIKNSWFENSQLLNYFSCILKISVSSNS